MKNNLAIILICMSCVATSALDAFFGKPFFNIRSQGTNTVRELVGWQHQINKYNMDHLYGSFSITPEYTRSFRPKKIADFLFDSDRLIFSGSRYTDRGANDILADYFGLPADFRSCVRFSPTITNFVMDLDLYVGLDNLAQGLFVRVDVPITHAKWDVKLKESVTSSGTDFHPAGYMSDERIERDALAIDVEQALRGATTFGDMQEPLKFGKIFNRQIKTRVAQVNMALGKNFLLSDWYHLGAMVRFVIPTGNKADAEFFFEPIAGNAHHWELGVGITSHVDVWESANTLHKLGIYCDANLTHLFTSDYKRSYDLTLSGSGSRYVLLAQLDSPSVNLNVADDTAAAFQYQGRLMPAINLTTLNSDISIALQGDIVFKLAYQHKNFECDFGYNFWARSHETLHCRCPFDGKNFVVKGDAQIYGFDPDDAESAVALSASQSKATLKQGQDNGNFTTGNEFQNINVDNPAVAKNSGNTNLQQLNTTDSTDLSIPIATVNTSNNPVFVSDKDIDECGALLPKAISHKLFIHMNYVWPQSEGLTPFLGAGFAVEFASTNPKHNSASSQIAMWVKGGLSF